MKIAEVEAAVLSIDQNMTRDSPEFKASVVLYSSAIVGTRINRLVQFTGVPRADVARFSRNLRANGVWRNGKIRADWLDDEGGGVAFILDWLVAMGMLERAA